MRLLFLVADTQAPAEPPQAASTEPPAPAEVMTSEIIATTPAAALKSVVDIQSDFEVRRSKLQQVAA